VKTIIILCLTVIYDEISIIKIIKMFDTLVLSGGSYKGYSYIGVFRRLEQTGIRSRLKNVSACSVGSIFGLLLVLGMSSDAMLNAISRYDVNKAYNFDIKSFMSGFGFCDFSKINSILVKVLNERGIDSQLTFQQLYRLSGINFVINATCLETKSVVYFNWESAPDMQVLKAVQMSCAIPLLFVRVNYEDKTYLDGGLLDNLPILPFKDKAKEDVLSIYLTENVTKSDLHSLSGYLFSVINMVTTNYNSLCQKLYYPDSYLVKICVPVNLMTLQLSNEQIGELIESGYQQSNYYFALWRAKYGFKCPNEIKPKFKLKLIPKKLNVI